MEPNGHDAWQSPGLSIDHEDSGQSVRIFGELYGLLDPMDLSLRDEARFNRLQREFTRIQAREAARAEAEGEEYIDDLATADLLSAKLGEIVQIIIVALPDEVLAEISDRKRLRILEYFSMARAEITPAPREPLRPLSETRPTAQTGARSFPASAPPTRPIPGRIG